MSLRHRFLCLALPAVLALAGCGAHHLREEPPADAPVVASVPPIPPAELDPWEPFNRSMHAVNSVLDKAILRPVARGYAKVTPKPVRIGVSNFFDNLQSVANRPRTPVRVLLRYAGEDPAREGLLDTPRRVVDAYGDWFSGYALDPEDYLKRTFEEVAGYDEMIVLRDIEFESHCEHHMAPIIGRCISAICRTARWSASASWRAWWKPMRAASRCRRR
jgi:hypothetical protein